MLKQSPSRNLKSKGNFKVKDTFQICVLLVICIWLLCQATNQTYNKKVSLDNSIKIPKESHSGHDLLKLGRKDINPLLGELAAGFEKHEDEEDQEQGGDESILKDNDKAQEGKGDDDIDGGDQEKAEEEETEQLDKVIDEDDGEKEEGIKVREVLERDDDIKDIINQS